MEIQIQREHVQVPVQREEVTTSAAPNLASSRCRYTRNPKYVCPARGCGRTFVRHFNLKGHMRNHYDEMEFACSWYRSGCEKRFFREVDCKRHEQLHLSHRPFTCKGCSKLFARVDALNRHRDFFSYLQAWTKS
ncbi:hypothetical protein PENSPDRAFT_577348 [Peniophora sp. CONT]|nr:hypothetical protein PENSPDRAFT_577348 [Peniophora sp. CONT]